MSEENVKDSGQKIAIITGGSRGLGRNAVLSLARRGVRSLLTYHRNRAEADKVAALAGEAVHYLELVRVPGGGAEQP